MESIVRNTRPGSRDVQYTTGAVADDVSELDEMVGPKLLPLPQVLVNSGWT